MNKQSTKGRPPVSEKQQRLVMVYLKPEEKAFAMNQGVSGSGYLRMLLLREMKKEAGSDSNREA